MSDVKPVAVAMIVAMAENRVIGRGNQLPWHLPGDLKYFKAATLGKPIVMGRKTYESIGRPLPGRANIVVTRDAGWSADGVRVASSPETALALAAEIAQHDGADEVMIIGGEQLYSACLPFADRLYITHVHACVDGDAYFPVLDWTQWREDCREEHSPEEGGGAYGYGMAVYSRRG